ncbi:hypothetical protein A2U01_0038515, partial [Trifolium medium]|nr:hypothetical protein [Trifolium medium]
MKDTLYGITALIEIVLIAGGVYLALKSPRPKAYTTLLKLFIFTGVNGAVSFLMIKIYSIVEAWGSV